MIQTYNLAMERIEHLVEMAKVHDDNGDEDTKEFLLAEAQILAMVADGADVIFQMKYHRTISDSFGVVFELTHGDPELMFGGM